MPSSQPRRLAAALAARFAVDRRALAAFRVALGAVLLVDLGLRARSLAALYSDAGALPRATLAEVYPLYRRLSLHALSGAVWFEALLFVIAGAAALSLLVGYRTRLATLCSLVLLVSLHARNPLALNSGDALLWRLLLWGAFLPLGSRWAVDAAGGAAETDRHRVVGVATAGLLVQTVVVYATNAVAKLRSRLWVDGLAVRHVFELDHFTVLAGDALAGHALLLTGADYAWLALLCASPLLLLTTGRRRTALTLAFVGVHLTMAATLAVGVFPLVSVAGLLPFLPSAVWDRVERVVERAPSSLPRRPRTPLGRGVPALSRVGTALAAVGLALLLVTNAAAVGVVPAPAGTPDRAVDHTWSMFAPPPSAARWYEAPATLESGARVDALSGGPVGVRPDEAAARYPSNRWRKVLDGARTEPAVRRSLGTYLCSRWNSDHADRAQRVEFVVVREPTDLDGPERLVRDSLGTYPCP